MKFRLRIFMSLAAVILIFVGLTASQLWLLGRTAADIQILSQEKLQRERLITELADTVLRLRSDTWDALLLPPPDRVTLRLGLDAMARGFYQNARDLVLALPDFAAQADQLITSFKYFYLTATAILDGGGLSSLIDQPDVAQRFRENQLRLSDQLAMAVSSTSADFASGLHQLTTVLPQALTTSAVVTVGGILVALLLSLLLSSRLTRRLIELTGVAAQVTKGNYGVRSSDHGGTEFAVLSQAFNAMLGQIERYTTGMSSLVEERTAELRAAQQQLVQSEKLAAMSILVAGIAHEINTPIGTALTAVSFLNQKLLELKQALGPLLTEPVDSRLQQLAEGVTMVERNIERASEMVSSFKQISVDQASDIRRRFELRTYVDGLLKTLQPRLRQHAVTVHREIPAGIHLDSHPGALSQILSNLVLNCLFHAFPGQRAGQISLTAQTEAAHVKLQVADDGVGMHPEALQHLFEPFFTTRRSEGGTGLGLFVTYNLVTVTLGGSIDCQTVADQGTVFTLTLPFTTSAAG